MDILAGIGQLLGTVGAQVFKVIVVDLPSSVANGGQVVLDLWQGTPK